MRCALAIVCLLLTLPAGAAEPWYERCATAPAELLVKPCEEALIDNPNDTVALKRLADLYLGSYAEWRAVELYARRILLEPDNAAAYFDQAAALATMWYFIEASAPLHRALDLAPDDLQAQRLAAIVFERSGETEAAFAAHRALAEAGIEIGMYDLAQDYHHARGTANDPEAARLWYERAATAGHVGAMRVLGEYLGRGALGVADPARADYWRQQAEAIREAYEQ